MSSYLLKSFRDNHPFISESAVDIRDTGGIELVVTMNNGIVYLYNGMDQSLRRLPNDPNTMTEDECRNEFIFRLRNKMAIHCVTQEELSYRTGIPQPMISRYLTGKSVPSFYNLDKIARALNCSIDDFRYV